MRWVAVLMVLVLSTGAALDEVKGGRPGPGNSFTPCGLPRQAKQVREQLGRSDRSRAGTKN
jgi:hypothetical protein